MSLDLDKVKHEVQEAILSLAGDIVPNLRDPNVEMALRRLSRLRRMLEDEGVRFEALPSEPTEA